MSWGVALRNAVGLGLGGIPSLLNAPPYARLAFNFLSGQLDPRITFSRTSNATLIGSDGTLQYAPHNLLTYSEQFDNSFWTKAQSTITSNSVVAPDGTTTADKLVEDATSATHFTSQAYSNSNVTLTFSIYIKAAERSIVRLQLSNNSTGAAAAFFDASSGVISSAASDGGDFTGSTATITSVGNGWYRCSLTTLKGAVNTTAWPYVTLVSSGTTTTYLGNGTSGIYVWGAQLNVGALQPYYSTTVKNLLGYSQEFDNAAWTKSNSTITANVTDAPDGSVTADKLVEDTAATIGHYVTPSSPGALALGQVVTYSAYAKAAERTFLQLILTGVGPAASNLVAGFDLTTGTAGTPSAGSTSSIVAAGNGWYRCSITVPVATANTPTRQIRISLNSSSTPSSYTGDGTSGIYVWGAQFSDSASLDPYVYNPAAAPSNTAYYGPRFDYDPVTLAAKGLLIEEQRTNICLYSSDLNQANWLKNPISILMSYDSTSAPDGTTTADTINVLNGTDTGVYQSIACSSSTTYTFSLYVKLGTMAASDYRIAIYDNTNSAFIAADIIPTQTPSSTAWTRVTYTFTTPATCVSVRVYCFRNGLSAATSVNVWGMQLEQGAFATSYIPTTTAAATRAADVASMTGANFSNWYNSVEGTMVTTTLAFNQTLGSNRYGATIDDGTTSNIISAYIQTDLNAVGFVVESGVAQYQAAITTVSNTSPNKIAITYKANDFMSAANGVLGIPDTSGAIPVVNKITFGNRSDGARPLNGHIRSFKYYNTRLSNGQLQTLTK